MKYYLISLNGYGELLKKNFRGKSLFEYAKKDNFRALSGVGKWGYVHLGNSLEKSYCRLFAEEKDFPGEAFVRFSALKAKTDCSTFFLARFLTQVEGRVIETDAVLSDKEARGLLDALSAQSGELEFFVSGKEIVAGFKKELPAEPSVFPENMKYKRFEECLYKNKGLADVNALIDLSAKTLPENPINKVRDDLGEMAANLLWLWGQGRDAKIPPVSAEINKETFYLPFEGNPMPLAELLGFEKIADISEGRDNSLIWLNSSLNAKEGASAWLKSFESLDRDILGKISGEFLDGKCRALFIFDGFMSPDVEIKNGWGVFMASAEKTLFGIRFKKYFRNGNAVVKKFLG
ncbi:MAG: hypothetical protein JW957_09070 [Candidatus Omnitrophica bacterium]|nr:hypothetical protein [Candidatus Omnitrophota bacterium]